MNDEQAKALGGLFRQRRLALGYTATQVAVSAGVPPSTVTRIERGDFAAPRPDKLAAFANYLGLSLADVFAKAGYVSSSELPNFDTYLATKYPDLLPTARARLSYLFVALAEEQGVTFGESVTDKDETDEVTESVDTNRSRSRGLRPSRDKLAKEFGKDFS